MDVTDPALGGAAAMVFVFAGDTTVRLLDEGHARCRCPSPGTAADGSLVSTADMDPCPDRRPTARSTGRRRPYRYAVEVPQGALDGLGLVEGSTIASAPPCTPGSGTA